MLPASCRLFSNSKSNSSTRVPSTTTTRVSSAWVASISIFFVMVSFVNASDARGPAATHAQRHRGCIRSTPPGRDLWTLWGAGLRHRFRSCALHRGSSPARGAKSTPPGPVRSGPPARVDSRMARTPVAGVPGSSKTTAAVLQCRKLATNTSRMRVPLQPIQDATLFSRYRDYKWFLRALQAQGPLPGTPSDARTRDPVHAGVRGILTFPEASDRFAPATTGPESCCD